MKLRIANCRASSPRRRRQDRRRFPILLLEPGILKALAEKPEADLIRFGIGGEDAR
jgi:hypothetical protein